MISRRPKFSTLAARYGWALAAALGLAGPAFAQHTPDPYNIVGEYNNQYEPYMFASQPNENSLVPNQSRFDERAGYRNANRFQSYTRSLDGVDDDLFGRGGSRLGTPGTPYYRARGRFDQPLNRSYRPNEMADSTYYENRTELNKKYKEAMAEPDARKRAQLLREFNMENLRAARSLSTGRNASRKERDAALDRDRVQSLLDEPDSIPSDDEEMTEKPGSSSRTNPRGLTSPGLTRPRSGIPAVPGPNRLAPNPPRAPLTGTGPNLLAPNRGAGASTNPRTEILDRARRAASSPASRDIAPPPPGSSR